MICALIFAAGVAALALTGCGSSNTISSLTDSDSTTASVPTQDVSASEAESVLPKITAQTIESAVPVVEENVSAVEVMPQEASAEEEAFEPAGEGNTATTTTDVKFRSSPDTDSDDNVIDELDEGTEVTVLASEDGWYKVQVGDETGYIKAEYVE